MRKEIVELKPTHLILAAGLKGTPNIDWFDKPENKEEGYHINVTAQVEVTKICVEQNVHCTLISSGTPYNYDEAHPEGSSIGFTEKDNPNYTALVYAQLRIELEKQLVPYLEKRVLCARIHNPISKYDSPGNLLTKIMNFPKVHQVRSSLTVLDEICPLIVEMAIRDINGTYWAVSPGVISPDEILTLYKEIIKPDHKWEIIPPPTNRPSAYFDSTKLETLFPGKRSSCMDAVRAIFMEWRALGK